MNNEQTIKYEIGIVWKGSQVIEDIWRFPITFDGRLAQPNTSNFF